MMPPARRVAPARTTPSDTQPARPQTKKEIKEFLGTSVDNLFVAKTTIKDKIKENISKSAPDRKKLSIKARTAFKGFSLSKLSDKVREDISYLSDKTKLEKVQKETIQRDIQSMKKSNIRRPARIRLSPDAIKKLGLKLESDGRISGEIKLSKLMKNMEIKSTGTALTIDQSLLSSCSAEMRAKESLDSIFNGGTHATPAPHPSEPAAPDNSLTNFTQGKLVKEKVNIQMRHVTSPENELSYGVPLRQDAAGISNSITAFSLKGGPADTASFHDFYRVDIAFQHIWTEFFDKNIAMLGEQLYQNYVQLADFSPAEAEEMAITSSEQLKQLINRIYEINQKIAEDDPRFNEVKQLVPELTILKWSRLDESTKNALYQIVLNSTGKGATLRGAFGRAKTLEYLANQARQILSAAKTNPSTVEKLLTDLEKRLSEKYMFHVFAPNSVNFGILVNYRQKWEPLDFQVGSLVSTIPLAPQEVRRYTKKVVVKKSRSQKEMENSLRIMKTESSDTGRTDAEIVDRASKKTNFTAAAEGGYKNQTSGSYFKASARGEQDSAKESADTKKDFREAVVKAAQEYRNEHRIEISGESSEESEETAYGEIKNPNEELAVTYLFYELQRQFEISEKLHKITPILLVANDVPSPDEIDEEWLSTNSWILRRVLLDDSFLAAFDYLLQNLVGNEIGLEVLQGNMERQAAIVEKISEDLKTNLGILAETKEVIEAKAYNYAEAHDKKSLWAILASLKDPEYLNTIEPDSKEAARIKLEAAKDALARIDRETQNLRSQLQAELGTLQAATDKYVEAAKEHFNRRTEILRLRAHIKDNILYYMQAIWSYEPADQRFFRLYNIEVPMFAVADDTVTLTTASESSSSFENSLSLQNEGEAEYLVAIQPPTLVENNRKKLVEIADLDSLLGFKGNYMMFPLKQNNPLTTYMMQDYIVIDDILRLRDPDYLGNYDIEELEEIMRCIHKKRPDALTEDVKKQFKELIMKRLSSPRLEKELVVVPTDSIYIEALPGKHPILEDFKLIHRAIDVKKVQAEVRRGELENVRLAARALKGDYEDPDIEKKTVIEGKGNSVVISDGDGE